jgi:hypothetical protein
MKPSSSVVASFTITSETIGPQLLSEILPFTPSKCWGEGEFIGSSIIRYKHNGAVLSLPERSVDDIEPIVLELLDKLDPVKGEMVRISDIYKIDYEISCVVYFARPPSCNLSVETVRRLAELRAAFDLDLIPCDIKGKS